MTIYEKVLSVFSILNNRILNKTSRSEIASEFSASKQYAKNDCVAYDNALWACTADDGHMGVWDSEKFSKIAFDDVVKSIADSLGTRVSDLETRLATTEGKLTEYDEANELLSTIL